MLELLNSQPQCLSPTPYSFQYPSSSAYFSPCLLLLLPLLVLLVLVLVLLPVLLLRPRLCIGLLRLLHLLHLMI